MAAKKINSRSGKAANPMWGGHCDVAPDEVLQKINASIGFDQKLYLQDITGSLAHAAMLAEQGIISKEDARKIVTGLSQIEQEIELGKFEFREELEDIHMNIEARLKEIIGDAAGRLHTARSRNDQVATDFRLWVRDAIGVIEEQLKKLQETLLDRAEENYNMIMPGFTHLQNAQPVTLGHHLLAYVEMFGRDRGRLADARRRLNECPLGSAALAGTSFPIDREKTAQELGFDSPMLNSLDAVSDRDFALEFLSAASVIAVHLSRLAEEFVVWSSAQFKFISLSEKFTTGSSIMPQKRNPDAAELVRGKTGRIFGAMISLLTTMKGLPLAYSKDMQEDKEPVFDAAENITICIRVMEGMVADFVPNKKRMLESAMSGFSTATDLADWLVRECSVPFRAAHAITGKIVKLAEKRGCALHEVPLGEMKKIEKKITGDVLKVLTVQNSVASRKSLGGTAPENVKKEIKKARKRFL